MVSGTTWVAIVLIGGLIVLGTIQHFGLPHTSLVGAVTTPTVKTQEEINSCMRTCMRSCVTVEGTEQACTDSCTKKCVPA